LPKWLLLLAVLVGGVIVAFMVVFVVLAVSYKTYYIPSAANEPILNPGDRIVVRKGEGHLHRGVIIVFKSVAPCQGTAPDQIKRIVAVAGDRVSSDADRLLVNGQPVSEPYLARNTITFRVTQLTVPPGSIYTLGDNRENSKDSRYCGPVPIANVIGRAEFRVWPPTRLGGI
jgi:signal peptidase I